MRKPEVYYTVKEAAEKLRLSERTIRKKLHDEEIRKTKVTDKSVRISQTDLDAYVRSKNAHSMRDNES